MAKRYYPEISNRTKSQNALLKADALFKTLTEIIKRDAVNYYGVAIVSERQLAKDLNIDRSVVHRTYEQLRKAGLLERNAGSKRYIIRPALNSPNMIYPCIGIVLPMSCSEYLATPGSHQRRQLIYNAIVDRAAELKFGTIPLQLPQKNTPLEDIQKFLSTTLPRVNGIIHLGDRGGDEHDISLEKMLEHEEIPQVFISSWTDYEHIGSVQSDIASAVNAVSHYLKEFGHKKIGLVSLFKKRKNAPCHYTMEDMSELKPYLNSAGMETRDEWMFNGISNEVGIREALRGWFNKLIEQPEYPTVFLCKRDLIALELISQIKESGYNVPGDFSVVGMQDIKEAETSDPPLTTLRQPMYDSGFYAVNMLFDFIQHGAKKCVRLKKLPMTLIARNSVSSCHNFNFSIAMGDD
jgi:DNA-binding LacI/PurR family transcriptional regulator